MLRINKKIYYPILFGCFLASCRQPEKQVEALKPAATTEKKVAAHPMDALTFNELQMVKEILTKNKKVDTLTRFPEILLLEPEKATVLAWKAGMPMPRQAQVVIKQNSAIFEAIVDLTAQNITSWQKMEGVQPSIMLEEWAAAGEIAKKDPRWQAAMQKRGYKNFDKLVAAPLTAGYFADPTEAGRRLLRVPFYDTEGVTRNVWGKPIEGVVAVVDLNKQEVVKLIDSGIIPVSKGNHDYDEKTIASKRSPQKKIENTAPNGYNFKKEGSFYLWDKWKFHFRVDKRFGPVVSMVSYDGHQVAHQLSANEMFVPYMDADENWSFRTYMDIGEYGFGVLASGLVRGVDVPKEALLLDAALSDDKGNPTVSKEIAGIFERNTTRPLWRHAEIINQTHESRSETELIVRMIPVVGNYDYVIDFVFSPKGELRIEVGATGMDAIKGVQATDMSSNTALADTKVGRLVAPNLVGVYHDHFLSFRLDLDIDGTENAFTSDRLVPVKYPNNRRKSGWELVSHPLLTENAIEKNAQGHEEYWRVFNPNSKNKYGQVKGFYIMGDSHTSSLSDDDFPSIRASWTKKPLWVTPYNKDNLYPSGKYPNQSNGSEGIQTWIKQKRSIDNKDLVVWKTLGFHHVTSPEDWPVLPTVWHTITLKPSQFFDSNPAMDVLK
jgi:primary-amine oxidase